MKLYSIKMPEYKSKMPESLWWEIITKELRRFSVENHFTDALLGLSGGMDSSLVAVLAADVFGPQHVTGVMMPSPYSSESSITDAVALAGNLGISTTTLPITDIMEAFERTLAKVVGKNKNSLTEENIQARIRGVLLMALANEKRALVLTTGNKSELGVGYCTLYGDMVGGIAPIADLTKTKVYRLARWINNNKGAFLPETLFTKAPSAELRPGQTDQDSLPPYELLDPVLERWLDGHPASETMTAEGFDPTIVECVVNLAKKNRFKILQAPPIIKVTSTPLDKSLFEPTSVNS